MKLGTWICGVALYSAAQVWATPQPGNPLPGRLFYTPAQRAMLNDARTHKVTESQKAYIPPESATVSFDGILTRSDGVATRWINGRPHVGPSTATVRSLKPGQTRAHQKVFESYQLLRPTPSSPTSSAKPATADHEATP